MLSRSATLVEAALPTSRQVSALGRSLPLAWARDLALIVAFAALVALCGRARFFLPDNPIPITLQTFGVLVAGAALGSGRGVASLLLFYAAGLAGLPVFQGGNAGWYYATATASGGYLVGFIAAAFVTGWLAERGFSRGNALWAMLLGNAIIYAPGLLWLGLGGFVPWGSVLSKGLYPFIPGDLLKLTLAGLALPGAWALVNLRGRRK